MRDTLIRHGASFVINNCMLIGIFTNSLFYYIHAGAAFQSTLFMNYLFIMETSIKRANKITLIRRRFVSFYSLIISVIFCFFVHFS